MRRSVWKIGIVFLMVGMVAVGCGRREVQEEAQEQSQGQNNATVEQSAVEVTGSDYAFAPDSITVKRGAPVTIHFKNAGAVEHNWVVPGLDVTTATVPAGGDADLTFTPNEAGEFEFICSVPGHKELGMVGKLIVEQ